MATTQDIVNEWKADDEAKLQLAKTHGDLILRWVNQAQLRFADKSEILRSSWSASIPSAGYLALPTDFLREFPDRVKYLADHNPLVKIPYEDAIQTTFSGLSHYSIFDGVFYVWGAQACSLTIPYVQKPAVVTDLTGSLEFPTEYHRLVIDYLDAMWVRRSGNYADSKTLLAIFDQDAQSLGLSFIMRTTPVPKMRGRWF